MGVYSNWVIVHGGKDNYPPFVLGLTSLLIVVIDFLVLSSSFFLGSLFSSIEILNQLKFWICFLVSSSFVVFIFFLPRLLCSSPPLKFLFFLASFKREGRDQSFLFLKGWIFYFNATHYLTWLLKSYIKI